MRGKTSHAVGRVAQLLACTCGMVDVYYLDNFSPVYWLFLDRVDVSFQKVKSKCHVWDHDVFLMGWAADASSTRHSIGREEQTRRLQVDPSLFFGAPVRMWRRDWGGWRRLCSRARRWSTCTWRTAGWTGSGGSSSAAGARRRTSSRSARSGRTGMCCICTAAPRTWAASVRDWPTRSRRTAGTWPSPRSWKVGRPTLKSHLKKERIIIIIINK